MSIEIEAEEESESGPCECCGRVSRKVWGMARRDGKELAAFSVYWTKEYVGEQGADFDFVFGRFDEDATAEDRSVISLLYRNDREALSFIVVDGEDSSVPTSLAAHALKREEVIGHPIAADVFAICYAILLQDPRVAELNKPNGQHFRTGTVSLH